MTVQQINERIKKIEEEMMNPELCLGSASTMSRITGYYRSVENFNRAKVQEYFERNCYNVDGTKKPGDDFTNYKTYIEKGLAKE